MSKLRKSKNLPVHIVEQHHDVVPIIHRAVASRLLPFSGIPVIHLDSHPDLLLPVNLQADVVFNPQSLYESLSIENWLLPLTFAKHVDHIVWVKPPWASQIKTPKQSFLIGKCSSSGKVRLTCKENYFLTDGLFRPASNLTESSQVTLQVVEVLPEKWSEIDTRYSSAENNKTQRPQHEINPSAHTCETERREITGQSGISQKPEVTSQPEIKNHPEVTSESWVRSLLEVVQDKPYILDVDLDFFSTANPFKSLLPQAEEEALTRLYHYPAITDFSDEGIMFFTENREKQLNRLEEIFLDLEDKYPQGELSVSDEQLDSLKLPEVTGREEKELMFLDSQQQEDLLLLCKSVLAQGDEREITFQNIHDFGCTLDETELPHHISTTDQINALQTAVREALGHLPKPAVVTIARSTLDGYCPPDVVNQLENDILKMLQDVYGPLETSKHYDE